MVLGLLAHLFMRYRSGQLRIRMPYYTTTEEKQPPQRKSSLVAGFPHDLEPATSLPPLPPSYPSNSTRSSGEEYIPTRFTPPDITSDGTPSDTNTPPSPTESNDERSTSLPIGSSQKHAPKLRVATRDSRVESQFNPPAHTPEPETRDRSQVYVLHHDAGRAPVTVYTGGAEVVELPPTYDPGQQSGSGYGSKLPEE